ncbi:DUF1330 domain-containing protein [Caballeronia sp. LZ062]|uniref:DUF1330 domain-containing protein n=1 Tax=unclassified Caballeronia TaxID=2646786 RepID=UPI00285946BD|nr:MULTISPECIES: DUF1330 domain-containing protein [unclassified Caballeronia]MDR5856090.1 DUF1330 domain-containing protein [Caballeronia sp. LZ050]MDR5872761.1 DUF1330 domain-containing protein [Caballeronia sp. LZ062]
MAKGYWVSAYRKIMKPDQVAEYSKLATVAIKEGGGRALVRGVASTVHGAGVAERTVLVEFDSLDQALATFNGEKYQEALNVLGDACERDFRVVEGIE